MDNLREQQLIDQANKISGVFSNPATDKEIIQAIKMGMIAEADLKDGQWYIGHGRGCSKARWDITARQFVYVRCKFGNFFEDEMDPVGTETRYAMFIPVAECEPDTIEKRQATDKE